MNVQNMRLRHGDGDGDGDGDGGHHLDGARDGDVEPDRRPNAAALDPIDRRLTARLIGEADADVIALQEVFDQETLDYFHDRVLVPEGVRRYPHRVCLPGNDGRGLDVALMSRMEIARVESHAALTPGDLGLDAGQQSHDQPVFRRDCLEADAGGLTFFVCHFKAPYPDAAAARPVRRLEALAVRRLIERRFRDPQHGRWVVLGDLNEPAEAESDAAIAPLLDGFSHDAFAPLDPSERWSYFEPTSGRYAWPDAILLSPALAREFPDVRPRVLRTGLGSEAARYTGPRFGGVGEHRPHASDHAALMIELTDWKGGASGAGRT